MGFSNGKGRNNMAKFSNGLVKGLKDEKNREKTEKNKQKIKNAVVKGTISPISFIIRKIATIILLILATIGLLTVIYPQTRSDMQDIITEQFNQIISLLNG